MTIAQVGFLAIFYVIAIVMAGHLDHQRGWRLVRRGLVIGALLLPAYATSILLDVRFSH